jgi:transposase-like protein
MEPKTLQDAIRYFSDENVCINTVANLRWPDGKPICPKCREQRDCYWLATQKRWKCKECGKQFSVKVGTIFEDSPISLDKWLIALWMLVNCKNGVSSYEVARSVGITQKSAWFVLHRLRLALTTGFTGTKIGGPGTECEADETFIGPKPKNMHKERRARYNQQREETGRGRAVVMGVIDRETREMRAKVVPDVKRETLQAEILKQVRYGSTIYTDDAVAYDKLKWRYVHEVVNHAECYVNGRVSTNAVENFWSLLKRNLAGTYVAVEPYHLFRYVDEQVFRFNNRSSKKVKVSDRERFELALSQISYKRLTFAELTGKVGETIN